MKSDNTFRRDFSQEDENMRPSEEGWAPLSEPLNWVDMEQDEAKYPYKKRDSESLTLKDVEVSRVMGGRDLGSSQEHSSVIPAGFTEWRCHIHNVSPNGGRRSGRSRSRSWSRRRSHSRSRSNSRNRRRSSPFYRRGGSERLSGRGIRLGGQAPPCRDFAAGHCRRASQCRFLHDNGDRAEFERYKAYSREINLERGSYAGGRDHRQRSRYDEERERPELHGDNRSTELCFDFTKGRCHRGSSCLYLHHEPSSCSGWTLKDETRDDIYSRRGIDAPSEGTDPRRVNDTPCKFFAEGRCSRGRTCRFSHQADIMEARPHARRWDYDQVTGDSLSKAASYFVDPPKISRGLWYTLSLDTRTPSHWNCGADGGGSASSQSIEVGNSKQKHQHEQPHKTKDGDSQTLRQEVDRKPDSQIQLHGVSGQHEQAKNASSNEMLPKEGGNAISDHAAGKAEINSVASVDEQSFSLPNLHSNAHIHATSLPLNGLSTANIGFPTQGHRNLALPMNCHTRENPHTFATVKQDPYIESPSGNILNSDDDQTSSQKLPGKGPHSGADVSEMEQPLIGSSPVISHKVVTSEQAARITDLSASLARFFGNAPLNVVLPATAIAPPPIQPRQDEPISGSLLPVKPENTNLSDPKMERHASDTDHLGRHQNYDIEQIWLGNPTKRNAIGIEEGKSDDKAHLEDADADAGDGDNKQSEDGKANKMFKYALVEFVKDLLKPAWKEGQLSREAHKTIVKKAVDKVTGSTQGLNVPQTQEKIDTYLVHSKPKLSKLVQAYVEKYVKN